MRARSCVPLTLCAALAVFAALAAPAGASSKASSKHFRLLPSKPCSAVLNAYDFNDDLQEVAPASVRSFSGLTLYSSSCRYAGTEKGAPGPFDGSFTNGLIGAECVANGLKLISTTGSAPEGGCYRIASASVAFSSGTAVKKAESRLAKGVKSPTWPLDVGRHIAVGVGTRAEFGYDEVTGKGFGYLQIDNATVLIETSEGANPSLIKLLKEAAAVL